MIYDTLFALDEDMQPQPQMVGSGASPTTSSPTRSSCATG